MDRYKDSYPSDDELDASYSTSGPSLYDARSEQSASSSASQRGNRKRGYFANVPSDRVAYHGSSEGEHFWCIEDMRQGSETGADPNISNLVSTSASIADEARLLPTSRRHSI